MKKISDLHNFNSRSAGFKVLMEELLHSHLELVQKGDASGLEYVSTELFPCTNMFYDLTDRTAPFNELMLCCKKLFKDHFKIKVRWKYDVTMAGEMSEEDRDYCARLPRPSKRLHAECEEMFWEMVIDMGRESPFGELSLFPVEILQEMLSHCVKMEMYEVAASLRDCINDKKCVRETD